MPPLPAACVPLLLQPLPTQLVTRPARSWNPNAASHQQQQQHALSQHCVRLSATRPMAEPTSETLTSLVVLIWHNDKAAFQEGWCVKPSIHPEGRGAEAGQMPLQATPREADPAAVISQTSVLMLTEGFRAQEVLANLDGLQAQARLTASQQRTLTSFTLLTITASAAPPNPHRFRERRLPTPICFLQQL